MSKNILGLDLGFSGTKSYFRGRTNCIKSVIGEGRKLKLDKFTIGGDNSKKILCVDNEELYFVGDLALKESNTLFHSLNSDRFSSKQVNVLAKSVIADTMKNMCEPITIVTGLPVDQYYKYRSSIKNMIESITNYEVTIDGILYENPCMIEDVIVVPQPFGAFSNVILDESGSIVNQKLASSVVAIIDIGFGTTDVLVCDGLSVVEKLSFSSDIAVSMVYKLTQQLIKEKTGKEEILFKLDEVVKDKSYRYRGDVFNIATNVNSYVRNTANSLCDAIVNKWSSSINDIEHLVISGGGSIIMSQYIREYLSKEKIEIVSDISGRYGIVTGYGKWGALSAR